MKKKKILLGLALAMSLSSCYNSKIACGNITTKTPVVKVNSEWNHHMLYGLVPLNNAKMNANDYVDGAKNYVVKTNISFVNGLVGVLTLGIYTPTTTTFYVPMKEYTENK